MKNLITTIWGSDFAAISVNMKRSDLTSICDSIGDSIYICDAWNSQWGNNTNITIGQALQWASDDNVGNLLVEYIMIAAYKIIKFHSENST